MAKLDNELTLSMKKWVEAESHTDNDDIIAGANMLLKLNRNQILFQTIIRRPQKYVEKIRYELTKHLSYRLAEMTLDDVKRQEADVLPSVAAAIKAEPKTDDSEEEDEEASTGRKGKREDHDALPAHIQAIWAKNAERWKKIKEAYNTCLTLKEPCDRYEYVKILKELWYDYKNDFNTYDEYVLGSEEEESKTSDPAELLHQIELDKKYVYKMIDDLKARRDAANADGATSKAIKAYQKLYDEMFKRVSSLIANNVEFTEEMKQKLSLGGINLFNDAKSEDTDTSDSEASE